MPRRKPSVRTINKPLRRHSVSFVEVMRLVQRRCEGFEVVSWFRSRRFYCVDMVQNQGQGQGQGQGQDQGQGQGQGHSLVG